jgi:hypothetical protein
MDDADLSAIDGFAFAKPYVASVWLTAGALTREGIASFLRRVNETMPPSTNILYVGCNFGRYGIMVEFESKSPRVASYVAKKIERLTKGSKSHTASASTLICRKALFSTEHNSPSRGKDRGTIRAYTFLNLKTVHSKGSVDSFHKYIKDNSDLTLYWNSSAYSFLLVIEGDCFHDVFSRIIRLRKVLVPNLLSMSTFFVLKWNLEKQDFSRDTPKTLNGHVIEIPAIVYVKLRSSQQSTDAKRLSLGSRSWQKMFSQSAYQYRRPGWLDECLWLEADTVYDIMKALVDLRKRNAKLVAQTSTLLLCPSELVNK